MLYWFFVKTLGPIARHRMHPTAVGLENIPRQGGGIIAANHAAAKVGAASGGPSLTTRCCR